jgi:hypothetical protein
MNCRTLKTFLFYLLPIGLVQFFLLFPEINSFGQDLLIFPKRIVFEGTDRKTEIINLSNTGQDSVVYEVSFVQLRMNADGSFENIQEPDSGQLFADKHVRFFPKKVTLAPRESQVVKVQLNPKSNLQPGEYRSHLYFRSISSHKSNRETNLKLDSSSISIRLKPVYGITIPVIIRVGKPTADISITDVSFKTIHEQPIVAMSFNRVGMRSTYGDINVIYTSKDGKSTKVAEITGFAVYTPGTVRKVKIELKRGVDYRNGTLRVIYSTQGSEKKARLAEAELMLN